MSFGAGRLGAGMGRLGALRGSKISSGIYSNEAVAFFARLSSQPTTARKTLYNNLIVALKSAGVWAKLDALYLTAADVSSTALTNLVSSSYTLSPTSAPTFAADSGYHGNGTSSYLDTLFNPTTAVSPKTALNSDAMFVWSLKPQTIATANFGVPAGNANNLILPAFGSPSPLTYFSLSQSTGYMTYADNSLGMGFLLTSRQASNLTTMYFNGASINTDSRASVGFTNANFHLLDDGLSQFSKNTASAYGFGAGLSATEQKAVYSAIYQYMAGLKLVPARIGPNNGVRFWPNQSISAGNVLQFNATSSPFTIIAAVQLGADALSPVQIISTNAGAANPFKGYEIYSGSGKLTFRIISNNATNVMISIISSFTINDNVPHVLAATHDGTGVAAGVNIYVDGVLDTSPTIQFDALAGGSSVSTSPLLIGNQAGFLDTFWPNGGIGYYTLSNIARSQAYIQSATLAALPAQDANTILSYAFAEGTGTTCADTSANNFTGTLSNPGLWIP